MKKLLITGTLILTAALLVSGVLYPDHPLMWLASTSTTYGLVRAGLIAILTVLLFSHPPRAIHFRVFLGLTAAILSVGTATLLFTYQIGIVDALVLTEIAIIFALEAFENSTGYRYQAKLRRSDLTA